MKGLETMGVHILREGLWVQTKPAGMKYGERSTSKSNKLLTTIHTTTKYGDRRQSLTFGNTGTKDGKLFIFRGRK